ncbi:hypothetical protein [Rhodovulum steppense]|uniref:Uncharacterized protein n=1 Tax=Rhodovulum steppense TaxID=540251 RepID=A0A4R1Z3Y1_9RHOB|nr:hypothetical protein [Rhodovulum steppense]TCM88166.1 hypothetical protein EV216_101179 [Rhodovulum steppense]
MGDLDRLNSKLAKLKGKDDGQIRASATDSIVSALLTEIEETILPREMILTNESGNRFVLVVAGRRLLALSGHGAEEEGSEGREDAAARIIAVFRGPFRTFLDNAREISIDAARPPNRIDPTMIGCSVETLTAALVGPGQASVADPVAAACDLAVAGLRLVGGDVVGRSGDAAHLARLEQFAGVGGAGLGQLAGDDTDAPCCVFLSDAGREDAILARIAFRGAAALILAPPEARAELIALCREPIPAAG